MINVRPATEIDLTAIQAIYAHHVLTGTGSFELEPPPIAEMHNRFNAIRENGMPYLVAVKGDDILGYAYANWFRPRKAYRFTVEDSIYIAPNAQGQGIGKVLLTALIDQCTALGCRQMIAVIGDSQNLGSIAVHTRAGFRASGILRSSGWKFDRWLDTVFMQRELGVGDAKPAL
jgi:L-amino acid N-acyltransferase YncA